MFVCCVIMLIISCTALHLCIEAHGVTFRENKLNWTVVFFFEDSERQTPALGPVSTV